ncbi:ubiquitin domain containing protein [Trichuris trichiura]|uniref:Ubiquitin domain containing protein n=1 Tax=Trichuris trichiura TaxID=36087 RepID=A0A077ZKX7_TRITR|nr:ubiquitin domain containing protein [Trichuris trichiura]
MSGPAVVVKVRSVLPVEQELFIAVDETWTVKDLKNHVSGNFPGQPDVLSQRLVCAGYLLEDDNRLLKDYLRPEVGNHHVVHLICKGCMEEPSPGCIQPERETPAASETPQNDGPNSSDEGLAPSAATEADHLYLSMLCYQQFIFYCYMAQVYGASWVHHYSSATNMSTLSSSQAEGQSADPNQGNDAGNGQPAAQPVINAQGQNEEDEQPRDWLDFLYIASRTVLLFSVLYMYSTVSRFVLVICCGFFFYAFEVGWFGRWNPAARERRNVPEPEELDARELGNVHEREHRQQDAVNGDAPAMPAAQDQPGPTVAEVFNAEPVVNATSQPISTVAGNPPNNETNSPTVQQQPSGWTVFWSTCRIFVSSFFVSLLPHRQVAVRQVD